MGKKARENILSKFNLDTHHHKMREHLLDLIRKKSNENN
jgi:hypothetical protein